METIKVSLSLISSHSHFCFCHYSVCWLFSFTRFTLDWFFPKFIHLFVLHLSPLFLSFFLFHVLLCFAPFSTPVSSPSDLLLRIFFPRFLLFLVCAQQCRREDRGDKRDAWKRNERTPTNSKVRSYQSFFYLSFRVCVCVCVCVCVYVCVLFVHNYVCPLLHFFRLSCHISLLFRISHLFLFLILSHNQFNLIWFFLT